MKVLFVDAIKSFIIDLNNSMEWLYVCYMESLYIKILNIKSYCRPSRFVSSIIWFILSRPFHHAIKLVVIVSFPVAQFCSHKSHVQFMLYRSFLVHKIVALLPQ